MSKLISMKSNLAIGAGRRVATTPTKQGKSPRPSSSTPQKSGAVLSTQPNGPLKTARQTGLVNFFNDTFAVGFSSKFNIRPTKFAGGAAISTKGPLGITNNFSDTHAKGFSTFMKKTQFKNITRTSSTIVPHNGIFGDIVKYSDNITQLKSNTTPLAKGKIRLGSGASKSVDGQYKFKSNSDIRDDSDHGMSLPGFRQPFIIVKPDSSTLTKYIKKYDSRMLPIGSAIQDALRMAKFTLSPKGIMFNATQYLLQHFNKRPETRLFNPLGVLTSTLPLMHAPRHINSLVDTFSGMASPIKYEDQNWIGSSKGKDPLMYSNDPRYPEDNRLVKIRATQFESPAIALGLGSVLRSFPVFPDIPLSIDSQMGLRGILNHQNSIPKMASKEGLVEFVQRKGGAIDQANEAFKKKKSLSDIDRGKVSIFGGSDDERQLRLRTIQDIDAIAQDTAKLGYEAVMKSHAKTKTREISWGMREGDQINKFGVLTAQDTEGTLTEDEEKKASDLIPFRFIFDAKVDGEIKTKVIVFRAILSGITDSFTAQWNPQSYIGRPDKVYTYQGGERKMGMSFRVFPHASDELVPIYEKVNQLSALTFPDFEDVTDGKSVVGSRMVAPFVRLTVGDMFKRQFVILNSVTTTFADGTTWDIDAGKRLPRDININCDFTWIGNKLPTINSKFYDYAE